MMSDRIVIIGGGIAGLATALRLAPLPVTLIAGAPLATGAATVWAQGGVAAAVGADDAPALHAADTLKAAAGIGDAAVANAVAAAGARRDRVARRTSARVSTATRRGGIALGLEAAHSRPPHRPRPRRRHRPRHFGSADRGRARDAVASPSSKMRAREALVRDATAPLPG